jgi:hypothetical protein
MINFRTDAIFRTFFLLGLFFRFFDFFPPGDDDQQIYTTFVLLSRELMIQETTEPNFFTIFEKLGYFFSFSNFPAGDVKI